MFNKHIRFDWTLVQAHSQQSVQQQYERTVYLQLYKYVCAKIYFGKWYKLGNNEVVHMEEVTVRMK